MRLVRAGLIAILLLFPSMLIFARYEPHVYPISLSSADDEGVKLKKKKKVVKGAKKKRSEFEQV